MIVFTACNRAYMPGAIALYKSFRAHNEGRFIALLEGTAEDEMTLRGAGMEVVRNPEIDLGRLPITRNRPQETALVHCYRLAIPNLVDERAIYIDADSLVLRSLDPLWKLEFSEPVAATESNASLPKEIGGGVPDEYGFISSLLIFNIPAWREQRISELCKHICLTSKLTFHTGEQGVMNWALLRNWHQLPIQTQAHVGHRTIEKYPAEEVFTLHFLGTNPWDDVPEHLKPYPEYKMQARQRWREVFAA